VVRVRQLQPVRRLARYLLRVADEKSAHEETSLQALVGELRARGRDAKLIARPDVDGHPVLTTDAIIAIDGREWAVDHCLVSRPSDLPPALAQAEAMLQPRLQAVADRYQCGLRVSYLPQGRAAHSLQDIERYYEQVIETATSAARSGEMQGGGDEFIAVQVFPADPPTVLLAPFTDTTGSVFLGTQVEAGLQSALTKKLTHQLKRAKDAGWPVALLLDQVPRPGSQNRTVKIATAYTIAQVTQRLLNDHPGVVDQVWLRPAQPTPVYVAPQVHLLIA
jgi:hypothetical protein